jgi:hypothetical protein
MVTNKITRLKLKKKEEEILQSKLMIIAVLVSMSIVNLKKISDV